MYREIDTAYWNTVKGNLKKEFPVLTNADLHIREGIQDDFLRTIAFKLGKTKKQLSEILNTLEAE
jgi:hypothetical protein